MMLNVDISLLMMKAIKDRITVITVIKHTYIKELVMKNIFNCISLRSELLATLLISTSLFCTLSLKGEVEDPFKVTRGHSSSHRSKEKECRECDYIITPKDIGCEGFVITRPGYYCLL